MHEHVSVAEGKMSFLGDETNACASYIGAWVSSKGPCTKALFHGSILLKDNSFSMVRASYRIVIEDILLNICYKISEFVEILLIMK